MDEVIRVDFEKQTVSARELHERLRIGTRFNDWFHRMCEYGFSDGTDFYSKMSKTENGGRPSVDYEISVDMAKQICMVQRTPEGKKCRQYLIDLEKAWNTPEQVMARALKIADKKIGDLAKMICQNGVKIGQKRLFDWMRNNGFLIKSGSSKNMPLQRYVEQGLFEIKESNVQNPDGSIRTTRTTKVTGKGQIYFVNKFVSAPKESQGG